MTPIERLEVLAAEMELASEPDGPAKGYFAPRLFEPWVAQLRAIIEALKQEREEWDKRWEACVDSERMANHERDEAKKALKQRDKAFARLDAHCAGVSADKAMLINERSLLQERLEKRDEAVRKVAEEMESLEAWAEKAMPPTVTMTAEDLIKIIRGDGARFGRLAARLREALQ